MRRACCQHQLSFLFSLGSVQVKWDIR